jgi:hypothetical protein
MRASYFAQGDNPDKGAKWHLNSLTFISWLEAIDERVNGEVAFSLVIGNGSSYTPSSPMHGRANPTLRGTSQAFCAS